MIFALLLAVPAMPACVADDLERQFSQPLDWARPWVYWFAMNGNLTREGITADPGAMKNAGIGIPRGPIEFMSPAWREMFKHTVSESDRLGLQLSLAAGPDWCCTGGPWIKPEQSMQHRVTSEVAVQDPARHDGHSPARSHPSN